MNCPDCEIPMYELFVKHDDVGEFSKCPLCGYRDELTEREKVGAKETG